MKNFVYFVAAVFVSNALARSTPDYERLDGACNSCVALDNLLTKHSQALDARSKTDLALKAANEIRKVKLKGLPIVEQQRIIYFSLKTSVEMLRDDFDSETVVRLIDLRAQAPKVFDPVLWHFPEGSQTQLIERMRMLKTRKVRPNATIPSPQASSSRVVHRLAGLF